MSEVQLQHITPSLSPSSSSHTTAPTPSAENPPANSQSNGDTSPDVGPSLLAEAPVGAPVNGTNHESEHLSDSDAVPASMSDTHGSAEGDQDWPSDGIENDIRRVKLYELVGSRWTDRGTAFCIGDYDDTTQEAKLFAYNETNRSDVLLSCTIRANDIYQRQQDTLIVWTEPDGTDYALSFQDVEGCAEVWDFIVEVQRHLNSGRAEDTISFSPVSGSKSSTILQILHSGRLPTPQIGIIGDIEKAIRTLARTPTAKERICEYIQQEEYVKGLLDVFHQAEDLENMDTLHALCTCTQTILLLNDHSMYEHILADDLWYGVVGMLEYDPEFPGYKANYREFTQSSKFMQPVVIQDPLIQRKIHQTFRLQYLKDVILARALDDSTFNVLHSCIIFNQIDIINHAQSDEHFLKDVVEIFVLEKGDAHQAMDVDGEEPGPKFSSEDLVARRKEVIILIQQLCTMGKNVQLPARIALFRTLVDRGVLYAVQWALCRPERHIVGIGGEILSVMLDHDTLGVRAHVLTQLQALERENQPGSAAGPSLPFAVFKETLLQVLCRMLSTSHELALQNLLSDALRAMLDVPQLDPSNEAHHLLAAKLSSRAKDEPATEKFLDYFYKGGVEVLFRPLLNDVPEHKTLAGSPIILSRERANLYLYLCDLLCSFAVQHSFRSHFFVLSTNIGSRVASLLNVRDKHLCLAALRYFRMCSKINNRNMFLYLIKNDILDAIIALARREVNRDNLLSSTCQEYFEHMRKENLKELINAVMSKHADVVKEMAITSLGAATFRGLIARWEINNEPPPKDEKPQMLRSVTPRWGEPRRLEIEEEDYFNTDDDDLEPEPVAEVQFPIVAHRRKRLRLTIAGSHAPALTSRIPISPIARISTQRNLVDYEEEEEEEGPQPANTPPVPSGSQSPTPQSPGIRTTPPQSREPSDPEDDLLESLVNNGRNAANRPPPSVKDIEMPSMRSREKRRRDEGDDDELLEKLVSKNKRAGVADDQELSKGGTHKSGEGPKRLKLKLGGSNRTFASRSNTKDGDGG